MKKIGFFKKMILRFYVRLVYKKFGKAYVLPCIEKLDVEWVYKDYLKTYFYKYCERKDKK